MADGTNRRRNSDPLWALLLALAGLFSNAGFFVNTAIRPALPWLSVILSLLALVFFVRGLRRALSGPHLYRGTGVSIALCVVALLATGLSLFGFYSSRKLPAATDAPQVGQKVPDFTLNDTSGRPVSLDSLLTASDSTAAAPKAVLLIFYRGYW
jgi:hypothetical protein